MIKYVDKVQGKMIKFLKIFALKENEMYKKKNKQQLEFEDFYLPFGGKLRSDNRKWIASKLLPKKYGDKIEVDNKGKIDNNLTVTIIRNKKEKED